MPFEIERLLMHTDTRGVVFEPLGTEMIASQRNAHVVISQPGVVRGNHCHRHGTEIIAVMGPALVRIRDVGELRDIEVPDQEVYRLILPPQVSHAIKNTGDRPKVLIAFNTCEHDPDNPDTVQDILIES